MYRRSYDYTITPEQREEFMKWVKEWILKNWSSCIINDYPYDMCRDKKVKTDHFTIFYQRMEKVTDLINSALFSWYTVQINSSDNQRYSYILR